MSRFRFAVWLGLVAIACSVQGAEPSMYGSSMHFASMHGRGCGCDGRSGCDGRVVYREPIQCGGTCGGMCNQCRSGCYQLCCPGLIPTIVNKIDCVLQWAFCDPCNMPCTRPVYRRPTCGYAWQNYRGCGCESRCGGGCGFEPGCDGGNWSPVTPADPFRDDDLKTPPPTPAVDRDTHTSNMSIYARPHVSAYRAKAESKMIAAVEPKVEIEPITNIDPINDTDSETELAVDESETSMVRHASAERKVEEVRKPSKKTSKAKVTTSETKSSSYPRNPLRDEE